MSGLTIPESIRLQALSLALNSRTDLDTPAMVVSRAKVFAAYISGADQIAPVSGSGNEGRSGAAERLCAALAPKPIVVTPEKRSQVLKSALKNSRVRLPKPDEAGGEDA